jgi:hypothetical protein
MTPLANFVARCEAAIEKMALLHAHTPIEAIENHLASFETNVQAEWTKEFASFVSADEVRDVVGYMVERVRSRRLEIEACGKGFA